MGHEESERQRMRTEEGLLTKLAVETEKNDMRMLFENERLAHMAKKAEWEARMEIHQVYV